MYGVNTFIRTAILLARPLMPFKVKIAQDFNHAFAIIREGVNKLMQDINVTERDWSVGAYWSLTIRLFIPLAAFILLFWWLYTAATVFAPGEWYNPLNPFSVMTCLAQWGLVVAVFVFLNRWMARKTLGSG